MGLSLVLPGEFSKFGASHLAEQTRGELQSLRLGDDAGHVRRELRAHCPSSPGVYGWIGSDGHLIYVGKSKSLRHRLISYFAKTPADPKMGRIRRQGSRLVWEPISSELLALLREQELINRFRPEFNSIGQPHRRQAAYVAISRSAAPHATVVKQVGADCGEAFGPLLGTKHLRSAVTVLNHLFQLRDCPEKTPFDFGHQGRLFDDQRRAMCLRYELGSCPGPCVALCSRSTYERGLQRAIEFLSGRDRTSLEYLRSRMEAAAARSEFERAALYRDRWQSLMLLDRQLARWRIAEERINGIVSVASPRGRTIWIVFRHGRLIDQLPKPRTARQRASASERLQYWKAQRPQLAQSILEVNWQVIIAHWFRQSAARLAILTPLDESALGLSSPPHSMSAA